MAEVHAVHTRDQARDEKDSGPRRNLLRLIALTFGDQGGVGGEYLVHDGAQPLQPICVDLNMIGYIAEIAHHLVGEFGAPRVLGERLHGHGK